MVPYTTTNVSSHEINAVFEIDMSMIGCGKFWVSCQKGRRVVLVLGILPIFLTACSVPDYVNPKNWLESKIQKQEGSAVIPVPGKEQSFPKLSSVPDRPDLITIARIRKELTEGLIADTKNARYTDKIIRREPPAPPPPPRSVALAKETSPIPKPKLDIIKPPPPLKLATGLQPRVVASVPGNAHLSVAKTSAKTETSTVLPVPSKMRIVSAPAKSNIRIISARAKQPAKMEVPVPAVTRPATTTMLAKPARPPLPPKMAALTTALPVTDIRPVKSTQVATIFFGSATASLTDDDISVLRKVAKMQRDSGRIISIIGHASHGPLGSSQLKRGLLNFKLSLDRANSVAETLIRFGVARGDVNVEARGDGELLYAETTAAGAAGNRRTEIFFEYF